MFVSRTGEIPEDFFPSENSLFWNSTVGVYSKRGDPQTFSSKWSFAQKNPQGEKVQDEKGINIYQRRDSVGTQKLADLHVFFAA